MRRVLGFISVLCSIFFVVAGSIQLFDYTARERWVGLLMVSAALLEIIFVIKTLTLSRKKELKDLELLDQMSANKKRESMSIWIIVIGFLNSVIFLFLIVSVATAIFLIRSQADENVELIQAIAIGTILYFLIAAVFNLMTVIPQLSRKDMKSVQ